MAEDDKTLASVVPGNLVGRVPAPPTCLFTQDMLDEWVRSRVEVILGQLCEESLKDLPVDRQYWRGRSHGDQLNRELQAKVDQLEQEKQELTRQLDDVYTRLRNQQRLNHEPDSAPSRNMCWHCHDVLAPPAKEHCECCPPECDMMDCDKPGCAARVELQDMPACPVGGCEHCQTDEVFELSPPPPPPDDEMPF